MKILIAQYGTVNLQYKPYSKELNSDYCKKNGYEYFIEEDSNKITDFCRLERVAIQWYKVPFILDLLNSRPDIDYILFLDLDAIISNKDFKVEDIINSDHNLFLANDLGHHSLYNTGVILVKNSEWSKTFFQQWWDARNNTSGEEVNRVLNWTGGLHKPQDTEIFKVSLWHEQTVLSYLAKTNTELLNNIKVLPAKLYNNHVFGEGENIFHAFGYNFDRYRGIKDIHEAKLTSPIDSQETRIVFFAYCAGEYLDIIREDIKRIVDTGLYDKVTKLFLVLSLPDSTDTAPVDKVKLITDPYDKVEISICSGNKFEHYGIVKAWVEAHKYNGQLFYFHAKGVTGFYSDNNKHSDWKREGDASFKEVLKYFTIDKHEKCLEKLKEYDEVIVSDSYARGWPSGNFWWVNTEFLRTVHFPFESNYDRWACEYWLNRRNSKYSTYQLYDRFFFRDKFTFIPESSYKSIESNRDKKINLKYAKLVTLMEPENENDRNRPTQDHAVDFTEFIAENLEKNNYKGFSNIQVSFNTLGRTISDPLFGTLKSLVICFTVDGDDTEYRLVGDEGAHLTFYIDTYNEVGYDYNIKTDKVIREVIAQ